LNDPLRLLFWDQRAELLRVRAGHFWSRRAAESTHHIWSSSDVLEEAK
jgi:hypothetical protein